MTLAFGPVHHIIGNQKNAPYKRCVLYKAHFAYFFLAFVVFSSTGNSDVQCGHFFALIEISEQQKGQDLVVLTVT